mgnify:CR=1 FL=1
MPRITDHAIVIRDLDYSESSQIVVLLTAEHGKLRGIAKGSRRMSPSSVARFSGGLNLLNRGQVVATTRPMQDLASITEWDLQDDHFGLRRSLPAQQTAMFAADLLNALLPDADPHPVAYGLLLTLIQTVTADRSDEPGIAEALLSFQWGLLNDCGYRPELDRDVRSDGDLASARAYSFDPQAGGLTTQERGGDWRVRPATVDLLRALANGDAAGGDADAIQRANRLLCVYVRALLDKELPTMRLVLRTEKK